MRKLKTLYIVGAVAANFLSTGLHAQSRPAPQGQPASPLRLAEALDYAQSHYPSVRAALAQKVAAGRDVQAARTAYLPQVNLLWQINRATVNNITGVLLPQWIPVETDTFMNCTDGGTVQLEKRAMQRITRRAGHPIA